MDANASGTGRTASLGASGVSRTTTLALDVRGLVQLPVDKPHRVVCHLGALLEERQMTLTALADAVGISLVNLSIMKNNRAKAIRYSTLTAICHVLGCQPGELLTVEWA